jgi:hypothetical protein
MDELIEELCRRVPGLGAARRSTPSEIDWGVIEARLGILPADYRAVAELFPNFTLCDFLHPMVPKKGAEQRFHFGTELEVLREWCAYGDGFDGGPYVAFPEPGGLLPWGESNEGDFFCWKTGDSDPDRWPVVLGSRSFAWYEYHGGMLEYIVGLLRGDVPPDGLPDIFTRPDPALYVYEA